MTRVTQLIHDAGKYLLISVYPLPTHPTHNFTHTNGGNLETLPGWPKKLQHNRPAQSAGQLAKDPHKQTHFFCNCSSWLLMRKMEWIREEVVNECKQKWKLKTYQVSRNFTIYTSCCQRFMVDTLKFRWRFKLRGVMPIAYIYQT